MSFRFDLEQMAKDCGGKILQTASAPITTVATDSRADLSDSVFFALKGEKFDAHKFLNEVSMKASAVVVSSTEGFEIPSGVGVILVGDTLKALQLVAHGHRKRWGGKLCGVAGSNGKTTTKEFCKTVLSEKFKTLATEGSLNNHFGVPLTLLKLRPEHRFAVIEMGMNHAKELEGLTQIASPDVAIVTNVGREHMEFFKNVEAVAMAEQEIYDFSPETCQFIFNLDNDYTKKMFEKFQNSKRKIWTYSSFQKEADVHLKEKLFTLEYIEIQGSVGGEPGTARMNVFGKQQVANAQAAACVALAMGVEAPLIWKGLEKCVAAWGRGQVIELKNGAKVLFDAYNANPESMIMALENFSSLSGKGDKFLFLGQMLELGSDSQAFHFEIGERASKMDVANVSFFGADAAKFEGGYHHGNSKKNLMISDTYNEKLAQTFGRMLKTNDLVLMKGSRGMQLERALKLWGPINFEE